MPPETDNLPAGAIQPEAAEAPIVTEQPAAPAQEASVPLSTVIELLRREPAPAHIPQAPAAPALPVEVQQFQRFSADDAYRSRVMREISGGRWSPENPDHVAMAEYTMQLRAEQAAFKADLSSTFDRKLDERFQRQTAEQQQVTVQSAFEAELAKPQYKNLNEGMQQMIANNVGALVQNGKNYQQAIAESFASIQPLLRGTAVQVPVVQSNNNSRPSTHSIAIPAGGAGKGGTKLTGRAGLNAVFNSMKSLKS